MRRGGRGKAAAVDREGLASGPDRVFGKEGRSPRLARMGNPHLTYNQKKINEVGRGRKGAKMEGEGHWVPCATKEGGRKTLVTQTEPQEGGGGGPVKSYKGKRAELFIH